MPLIEVCGNAKNDRFLIRIIRVSDSILIEYFHVCGIGVTNVFK